MERSEVGALVLHAVRRVLSRHARAGPTAVSLLRLARDRHRYAGLADGARRSRIELRGIRVASVSRVARSDFDRTVGSGLLARHGTAARLPAHHHAAGISHRAPADDQRLCLALKTLPSHLRSRFGNSP